jgi:CheY-like chemotaxis protein/histone H3/H4
VFQPVELSLSALITDFERMLRRIVPSNIEISTVLKSVGQIRADAGQIEQIIMNLATNARDAMKEGGRLTIKTVDVVLDESCTKQLAEVAPGNYVLLAVSDTGHGMTPEIMTHIFEPFYTTKERGKGTGLGLGTVHGVVKQSGGSISVYSEPGRGTTFKIYFPRLKEDVEPATLHVSATEMPRGSETILLVEDEAKLRNILSEILRGLGYSVLVAEDGQNALGISAAHEAPIDLLITDIIMPGIGGRELANHLVHARPELNVLYISGYTDDSIITQGVFSNKLAFLQKPISTTDLAHKVRAILDEERAGSPANVNS